MTIKRALLVVAHNLGDAVITAGFLENLHHATPGLSWTVLCRPEAVFLFESKPGVERVLPSRFPVGTNKQFNSASALSLLRTLRNLRKDGLVCSLDFIGDFRDVAIARLAGSPRHFSPVWADDHPFRRIIRAAPASWIQRPLQVASDCANLYDAMDGLIAQLATEHGVKPAFSVQRPFNRTPRNKPFLIGLHPFATQACKHWPTSHWRELAKLLLQKGYDLRAFAAPSESTDLRNLFGELIPHSRLLTNSLPAFFLEVGRLDLLIGLDSFSVHVAHFSKVPSIMLNGANHPTLWVPRTCTSLQEPAHCGNQPCMNVPTCAGADRFRCMTLISPSHVERAATLILESQGSSI